MKSLNIKGLASKNGEGIHVYLVKRESVVLACFLSHTICEWDPRGDDLGFY